MRATWRNVAHFLRKGELKNVFKQEGYFLELLWWIVAGVGEACLLTPLSYMYVAPCSCIATHSHPLIVNGNACRKAMTLDMYSGAVKCFVAETRVSLEQEKV